MAVLLLPEVVPVPVASAKDELLALARPGVEVPARDGGAAHANLHRLLASAVIVLLRVLRCITLETRIS